MAMLMAGASRVCSSLVRFRARRLPHELSERFGEEWLAEASELGGRAARLAFAFGLLLRSNKAFVAAVDRQSLIEAPGIEFRAYSDYGERLIAFVLDQLALLLFGLVMVLLASLFLGNPAQWTDVSTRAHAVRLELVRFVVPLCAYAVIYVYCVVRFGASPGKIVMKLRIVTVDGSPLTARHAIIRVTPWLLQLLVSSSFGVIVALSLGQTPSALSPGQERALWAHVVPSWLVTSCSVAFSLFGLADLGSFYATAHRRSLRDLLAGTVVVLKVPESIAISQQAPVKSTSMLQ